MSESTYEEKLRELIDYIFTISTEDMKASKKVKAIQKQADIIGTAIVNGELLAEKPNHNYWPSFREDDYD